MTRPRSSADEEHGATDAGVAGSSPAGGAISAEAVEALVADVEELIRALKAENASLRAQVDAVRELVTAAKAFDEAWRKGPKTPGATNQMFAARLAMREAIAALG